MTLIAREHGRVWSGSSMPVSGAAAASLKKRGRGGHWLLHTCCKAARQKVKQKTKGTSFMTGAQPWH